MFISKKMILGSLINIELSNFINKTNNIKDLKIYKIRQFGL